MASCGSADRGQCFNQSRVWEPKLVKLHAEVSQAWFIPKVRPHVQNSAGGAPELSRVKLGGTKVKTTVTDTAEPDWLISRVRLFTHLMTIKSL